MVQLSFYCTLGSEVHVQIIQDCCIGKYMARWFVASIPPSPISGISPHVIPPQPPYPTLFLPSTPNRPQCMMLPYLCLCVLIVQHLPMSENMWCLIFLFLCQFAENDGFQIHPCPYKRLKLIFYGCKVFHGVYVPHFSCTVYH